MDLSSRKNLIYLAISISILLMLFTTYVYNDVMDISTVQIPADYKKELDKKIKNKKVICFGVISRYPPRKIYEGYQPIMDYLSDNSDYSFNLKLSNSYQETIQQLLENEVQLAFLGTYIYYKTYKTQNLRCILKPNNEKGEPFFHSTIITAENSDINRIEDLRGKKLALSSLQSLTANIIPANLRKGRIFNQDLKKIQYFNHHTTVIQKVLKGEFDAGAVKNLIAEKYINSGLKIIYKSKPFPSGPITVSNQCDTTVINIVKSLLLKIDITEIKYQNLVAGWDGEFKYGFTPAFPQDYFVIRKLLNPGYESKN